MGNPDYALLQAYKRAAERLQDVERQVHQSLLNFFEPSEYSALPTLRQLAFLEGLRRERDDAYEVAQRAEADLVDKILSRLGIPPDLAT